MSPRSRRHGVSPSALLAVLVTLLLALGLAGTASAGSLLAAQDVVVNVTAGANDPVRGATVVARDDRTGRVMSNATTTGHLGYAAIRLRPGASTQRITITATGGRSKAVGTLSAADVMSATAQRAVMASEIEVNVNPGSTVLAEYLDERPRASVAAAERAVARRLRLPTGTDVAESARFSRVRFSGEDFIDAARNRRGVEDYAEWAAERISAGTALPDFAAQVPADNLPYRGSAGQRRNDIDGLLLAPFKPLLGALGTKVLCAMALPQKLGVGASLCEDKEAARQLSPEDKQQLDAIERGISNLRVQMSGVEATLGNLDVQVGNLGGQVATLKYQAEMNAVDDVVKAAAVVAGVRAQGGTAPDHNMRTLQNALVQRLAINAGCPDWAALVGSLPPAVMRDAQGPRHPDAACAPSALGVGTQNGLLQFAQRTTAAASRFVAAGPAQATVDAAGEFWLGEFARNVFSMNMSLAYALQTGTSTRNSTAVDATARLFEEVVAVINVDATGTYFGARIPNDQVLAMGATQGTIYGIGSYKDPGNCRGEALWPVQYRFAKISLPDTHVVHIMSYLPGGAEPLDRTRRACRGAELIVPPPAAPGARSTLEWQPAKEIRADHRRNGIGEPLRRAALCRMQEAVVAASTSRPISRLSFDGGGGTICVPGRTAIPERLGVEWSNSGKKASGVLPNLQLSLDHGACAPWEVGTAMSRFQPRAMVEALIRGGGGYATPQDLVTAVGMQCPVTDLTPRADKATGWNCVSANPSGRVASASFSIINGVSRPGSFDARPVTSSLGSVLDVRSMGGYCPIGSRYDRLEPSRWYCSPGLRPPIDVERLDCTSSGLRATIGKLTSYVEPGSTRGQTSRTYRPVVPSGARLDELRAVGINVGAQNWTSNNDVAGDFVVGPLYTSDAVGVYIPGTTPGGPLTGDVPPRRVVQRASAVRDLAVECVQPCTGATASVRVRWRAPERAGGLPIQRYEVRAGVWNDGARNSTWQDLPGARCSTRGIECTVSGLNMSADIQFFVYGVTLFGDGDPAWATLKVGLGTPVLAPVVGGLTVRWSAPVVQWWNRGAGPVTSWRSTATAAPGGRSCSVTGVDATTCTIVGLEPGQPYTVTVKGTMRYLSEDRPAQRETAPSPQSAPGSPLAWASSTVSPGTPVLTPVSRGLTVRWSAPVAQSWIRGAGPGTSWRFTATAAPGGRSCSVTGVDATTCTIVGLEPGQQYTVTVMGTMTRFPDLRMETAPSPQSEPGTPSGPRVRPGAPDLEAAVPSDGQIAVKWRAPASEGDSPIVGYAATATAMPGGVTGATCTTTGSLACTIDGLSPGTEYTVSVTATNEAGTGDASPSVRRTTPGGGTPGTPVLAPVVGGLTVRWSAPVAQWWTRGAGPWSSTATAAPAGRSCSVSGVDATTCTIVGLEPGQQYTVTVTARNAMGTAPSPQSAPGSPLAWATSRVSPGTPVLTPVARGLTVRWSAPVAQSWIRGAGPGTSWRFTATAAPGGRSCSVTGVDATTCTIVGLEPGQQYTVTVMGTMSPPSWLLEGRMETAPSPRSAPATPFGPRVRPGAPDLEAAVPSDGRIAVKWRAPASDGNSPIVGYTATAMPGGATCTTTGSLACAIDGLSPGTEYTVSVTATNEAGTGDASPSVRRTTPTVLPGPPLTPLAKASPGTIEVSWVAPDFDGGAAITGYTATASPGGAQCTTDGATTCTITGLPDGTEHQVTVTATNAVGTGPASVPAAARTPDLTPPGAPRSVELTALPGRIEVAWSAPESDGGSAVTGYIATATPGGATCTTTGATLCTITGLDNGTAYRVAVAAINVIGTGAPSDAGEAVTPRRNEGGAAPVVDDLPLQATSIPGTADSGLPVSAPVAGRTPEITGLALRPRTLVPGLGGRIAYSLSEPADVTITIARVGGRDRASRVVHRIPAGRPGALAGDARIRVLYSFASARRKKPGAWTLTVEARDAQGGVATKTIPIRVRT